MQHSYYNFQHWSKFGGALLQFTPTETSLVHNIAQSQTMAAMDARVALYMGYGEEIFINLPQFPQVVAENISQLQLQFKNQLHTPVFSIMPNPATSTVQINYALPAKEHAVFTMYDVTGKTVYRQTLQESGSFSIDISQWTNGLYYYNIIGNKNETITGKFIVIGHH